MSKKISKVRAEVRAEWDRKNAMCDAFLIAFVKPIKYDYTIPDINRIDEIILVAVKEINCSSKIPKELLNKIIEITQSNGDYYSLVAEHMSRKHIFGSEWFWGCGSVYRWRPGELKKAQARVKKYIPKEDLKYILEIQKVMIRNCQMYISKDKK